MIPLLTGPAGSNPVLFPISLGDLNGLIQSVNAALLAVDGAESAAIYIPPLVTNVSATLNAALVSSAQTGLPVILTPGQTYLCTAVGTKFFVNPSGLIITKNYCVQVPSGATLNLNGATLQIAKGLDAVLLSNANTAVAGDVVTVINGTLDGNGNVPTVPMTWFWGCSKSSFISLTAQNVSFVAAEIVAATDCFLDKLLARSIIGQAWIIGGNTSDQCARLTIGTIEAYDVASFDTFNEPGNGIFLGVKDSSAQCLRQRNTGGGIKLGPNCSNVNVVYAEHDGTVLPGETDHNTTNCGIKIQGDDASSQSGARIQRAVARGLLGSGFFANFASSPWVGSYDGRNNGRNGIDPDISIANYDHLSGGEWSSRLCGGSAFTVGAGAGVLDINQVDLVDIAQTPGTTNKIGFLAPNGTGRIGRMRVWETVAANSTGKTAVQLTSANTPYRCPDFQSDYVSGVLDIRQPGSVFGNVVLDSGLDPLQFEYAPAAGATSTTVGNNNIRTITAGAGFVEPLVIFVPMNAAAVALLVAGGIRYTIPTNRNITIDHAAAAGTERFSVRIVEYEWRSVQFA